MKRLLLSVTCAFLLASLAFAADPVSTKEYFPIATPHGYILFNGATMYRYEFLGQSKMENRLVYLISKTQIGTGDESGEKKEVYSRNEAGDIHYLGYVTANTGKIKWEKNPSLKLKGKMEIGKTYTVEYLNNGKVTLTLKRFQDVKLKKKVYKQCLVVEKYTSFDKRTAPNSMDLKNTYYYAKGIGVIKIESLVYRMKDGKLVQEGPMESEWIEQ